MLLLSMSYALTGVAFVPLAVERQPLKSGGRYPCESCACGCSSAQHCWDKCCCHTDAQKIEWAERNGIKPPDFLVVRVKAQKDTEAKSTLPACCAKARQQQVASAPEKLVSYNQPVQSSNAKATNGKLVLMWKAAECKGLKHLWLSLAEVYLPSAPSIVSSGSEVLYKLVIFNDSATSYSHRPDPPIP